MKSTNKAEWAPEAVATLREQWGNGRSGTEIAALLGNVSREAVIAKANRLKLRAHNNHGGKRIKQTAPLDLNFGAMPRMEPVPVREVAPFAGHVGLTLMELTEATCKWPTGTELPFSFCGAPVHVVGEARKPYCPRHYDMAYKPREVK